MMQRQRSSGLEPNKAKIKAKSGLETIVSCCAHSDQEKARDKLEGGDKEKIKAAVQETLSRLE